MSIFNIRTIISEYKKEQIIENIRLKKIIEKKLVKETFNMSGLPIDPQSTHLIPTKESLVQSLHTGLLHLEQVSTVSLFL
tara:strand:- start:5962 stop:6201 length:240 start_codon:yes stop_codon:yes gene_type:complete